MSENYLVEILISISGFLYFFLWSASFYGPILTLYRQKTAMGVDSNYIFINISGYTFYAVYNAYGFLKNNNNQTGNVFFGDILYSVHCIILYSILVSFYFYYPHRIKLNKVTKIYTYGGWAVFIIYGLFFLQSDSVFYIFGLEFGYIRVLGYLNTTSSLLKHPPQIYYNYKRKSTKGWDITSRSLDLAGGCFSFLQIFLLLSIDQNFKFNWAKFFLAFLSILYDLIYIIQHYFLYKNHRNIMDIRQINKSKTITPDKDAAIQYSNIQLSTLQIEINSDQTQQIQQKLIKA